MSVIAIYPAFSQPWEKIGDDVYNITDTLGEKYTLRPIHPTDLDSYALYERKKNEEYPQEEPKEENYKVQFLWNKMHSSWWPKERRNTFMHTDFFLLNAKKEIVGEFDFSALTPFQGDDFNEVSSHVVTELRGKGLGSLCREALVNYCDCAIQSKKEIMGFDPLSEEDEMKAKEEMKKLPQMLLDESVLKSESMENFQKLFKIYPFKGLISFVSIRNRPSLRMNKKIHSSVHSDPAEKDILIFVYPPQKGEDLALRTLLEGLASHDDNVHIETVEKFNEMMLRLKDDEKTDM